MDAQTILADIKRRDKSMLQLLQEVDPNFVRKDLHAETAINAKGFEVNFLRRMQEDATPTPSSVSDAEQRRKTVFPVAVARRSRGRHRVLLGRLTIGFTPDPSTW